MSNGRAKVFGPTVSVPMTQQMKDALEAEANREETSEAEIVRRALRRELLK